MDVSSTWPQLPADTLDVLPDSSVASPCLPLSPEGLGYEPTYENSLRSALDSNVYLSPLPSGGEKLTQLQLLPSVSEREPLLKESAQSPLFYLLLMVYLLMVAIRRFRLQAVMGTLAGNRREGTLPLFFAGEHSLNQQGMMFFQFVTLGLGAGLCLASALYVSGRARETALAVLASFLFMCGASLLRFLSALLLDVQAQSVVIFRKKLSLYYNLLLLLIPVALVHECYPFFRFSYLLAALVGIVSIYLLVNTFVIFSKIMRGYGIFLYFCTLEIVPIALSIICFLKYSIISI